MSHCGKQILSPFTGSKIQKAWNKISENCMQKETRHNLAEKVRESYCNLKEWSEEFRDNKGAFYNGRESDNSDNDDDENYNENNEHCFSNNCYKIVLSILSSASNVVVPFDLLKMYLIATVLEEYGTLHVKKIIACSIVSKPD